MPSRVGMGVKDPDGEVDDSLIIPRGQGHRLILGDVNAIRNSSYGAS